MKKWHVVVRFIKYAGVGIATFIFDLALLFLLTDALHIHYIASAGIAFLIATSANYEFSRKYVFKGTLRPIYSGFGIFLLIALVGLLFVTGLMYLFVSVFSFHYLIARTLIAGAVGLWNYLMNLYINFRVAEL